VHVQIADFFIERKEMSYNTAGIALINNYGEALRKLLNTKPIKSKQAEGRIPLGIRRYHTRASISRRDDTILLNSYDNPFVEWSPDNTFKINPPKYRSVYMCGDLSAFLPVNMYIGWANRRYTVQIKENGEMKQYFLANTLCFRPTESSNIRETTPYELVEKPTEHHARLRASRYKPLLKAYEPWLDWFSLIDSLDAGGRTDGEWEGSYGAALRKMRADLGLPVEEEWWDALQQKYHGPYDPTLPNVEQIREDLRHRDHLPRGRKEEALAYHSGAVAKFLEWIGAPLSDNWVSAMHLATRCAGVYSWQKRCWIIDRKRAQDFVKDLVLHHHRNEVFDLVPTVDGQVPTKRNAEYFRTFSFSMEKPSC
jgi:hypothetical protein